MDPVSQAALGAVVGQISGHRQLGYRAALLGAAAGALPDIDVLFAVGGDYFDQLVLHRGITHSLFFAPVAGPILGALAWWLERRRAAGTGPPQDRLGRWVLVATLALWSHPLLDYFTPYGTQLLLPFSDARFALNAMPIIDPLYTAVLLIGLWLAGRRLRHRAPAVALAALLLSSAYIGYAAYLNGAAERLAARQLAASGVSAARIAAFPTILQVHYRRVVARTAEEDLVGFVSLWKPCPVDWATAPRDDPDQPRIQEFLATREGRVFDWFTMGWARYRVSLDALPSGVGGFRVRASDLRYGFDDNPDRSIFNASARFDAAGRLIGPVLAEQDLPAEADATGQTLALLFRDAYAPVCSSQSSLARADAKSVAGMARPYR